ncbi:hypothetical protein CSV79_04545 [Sporosarcina sp. P13]|uniref:amidohydrolase n=1 Tax=Sporosarcina sp. P13 TaxID=2048263 RepID=UPI000C163EEC|nr:amidohydrolase [Sporosarcina sp. P13]PIC64893.1 hypothetical protein CSV79_04545 [Sporosarcina sp. P13]
MERSDLLIINANILTLDNKNSKAGSLSIVDGKVSGIWDESIPPSEIIHSIENEKIIDLQGATLIPGFIDTHNHILVYAQNLKRVNCSSSQNKNINDILSRISEEIDKKSHGEWVRGYGYDDTLLEEQRHPTREELDTISPNNPVYITHISGHIAVVNSLALKMAGITKDVLDSKGGLFGRFPNGELNGVLYEKPAMKPILDIIPPFTENELISMLGEAAQDYLAQGITTNTDAGLGIYDGASEYEVHLKAFENGSNPLKTRLMFMHTLLGKGGVYEGWSASELDEMISNRTNGHMRLDSAKLFQDGSIQGLTGALRQPYYCDNDVKGALFHEQHLFNEELVDLHKRGFRIAIHGNGDRAIGSILESYDFILNQEPRDNHRHRIEHVQTATIEDLDEMERLNVAGSFFINHVYYWGDRHYRLFLGPERAKRINPLADAVKRDLLFTIHSDCPITPISPLFSVWAAVNRITKEGKVLGEDQQIDVVTALKSMTIYGAKLNFDEENTGSIEVGKFADFAVLDQDPTRIDPMKIKDISVISTFINGKNVYKKEAVEFINSGGLKHSN